MTVYHLRFGQRNFIKSLLGGCKIIWTWISSPCRSDSGFGSSASSGYCIASIRIAFPSDAAIGFFLNELVLEGCSDGDSDRCCPKRIRWSVWASWQSNCRRCIPRSELADRSSEINIFSVSRCSEFIENHRETCCCCACGSGCCTRSSSLAGSASRRCWRRCRPRARSPNGNVRAMKINLGSLERIPSKSEQGMIRLVVWYLDLLGNCITSGNCRGARSKCSPINSLAATIGVRWERIASKPVIAVACLPRRAVWVVSACLAGDIRALQLPFQKAIFCSLLFVCCGEISGRKEQINKGLVLTDPVSEHSTMITIIVDTPLNFDCITCSICCNYGITPIISGLVIIDADSSVVSARSTAAHLSLFKVWPGSNGFKNRAFWASVDSGLWMQD